MDKSDKYSFFTTGSISHIIISQAVPTIITMLVTSIYNIADTFYVGRINTQSTAAVGVAFSLMAIIQGMGFFFGHGSGNFIARRLGARDTDSATYMAATGFILSLLVGILIAILGHIFLTPLCRILGATESILPYTEDYLSVILLGAPLMTGSLTLNNQMRYQGNAVYSMIAIVSGAILNIAVAPIFIFTLGYGVKGAAIATVICQAISFVLLVIMDRKGSNIKIDISKFRPNSFFLKEIARGGSPSICRQGLASVATLLLNVAAGAFGDSAIAAMTIVTRFSFFIFAFLIGFGQGYQPFCGFNYGAKLNSRVINGFWFCVKVGTIFLTSCSILAYIFAPNIIQAFRNAPDVISIGTVALRWQACVWPIVPVVTISNMLLQTIRMSGRAVLIASARQGLFFMPLIFILPHLLGLEGVEICQAVSDLLSFVLTLPIVIVVLHQLQANKTPNFTQSSNV